MRRALLVLLLVLSTSGCVLRVETGESEAPGLHKCIHSVAWREEGAFLRLVDKQNVSTVAHEPPRGVLLADPAYQERWFTTFVVEVHWKRPALEGRMDAEHAFRLMFTDQDVVIAAPYYPNVTAEEMWRDYDAFARAVLNMTDLERREESYRFAGMLGDDGIPHPTRGMPRPGPRATSTNASVEVDALVARLRAEGNATERHEIGRVLLTWPEWTLDASVPMRYWVADTALGSLRLDVGAGDDLKAIHRGNAWPTEADFHQVVGTVQAKVGLANVPWENVTHAWTVDGFSASPDDPRCALPK
jgi:hypothetical protein